VTVLAAIRPDNVNFPLLVHVLGATVLVGGLMTAFLAQLFAWRREEPGASAFTRLSFWALLLAALPGWIVMRVGAEWVYSREGWDQVDTEPDWIGIGYVTAEPGALLLLISLVLAGLAMRRRSGTLARIATVLTTVMLVAYVIAIWAMTAKPT
jgi:hypothetical protein